MYRLFVWMSLTLLVAPARAQDIHATTEDGRFVLLRENGRWEFVVDSLAIKENPGRFTIPPNAKSILTTKVDAFNVHYDSNVWDRTQSTEGNKITFGQKNGEVYAIVIVERGQLSLEGLKSIVLKNAQSGAPGSYIEHQEYRMVNGTRLLCLQMHTPTQQAEFTFYGYYFTDKRGSVQIHTYTFSNLFDEHRQSMTDFLDGFVVTKELPPANKAMKPTERGE